MREDVQLRDAAPADSAFVFEVRRLAFREYVELEEGWNDDRELERHLDRFERQRFRVIGVDGVDAGYIATAVYLQATTRYPASLYLHQLMVLPTFHSKGIGSACLGLLRVEAQVLALPIRLRVLRVNPRALAFYLAAGCGIVGESDSHVALELRGW